MSAPESTSIDTCADLRGPTRVTGVTGLDIRSQVLGDALPVEDPSNHQVLAQNLRADEVATGTGPQDALGEVAPRTLLDEHDESQTFELVEMLVEALKRRAPGAGRGSDELLELRQPGSENRQALSQLRPYLQPLRQVPGRQPGRP